MEGGAHQKQRHSGASAFDASRRAVHPSPVVRRTPGHHQRWCVGSDVPNYFWTRPLCAAASRCDCAGRAGTECRPVSLLVIYSGRALGDSHWKEVRIKDRARVRALALVQADVRESPSPVERCAHRRSAHRADPKGAHRAQLTAPGAYF